MKKQLNEDFVKLCKRFVDNKLSIQLRKDKINSNMFALKQKIRKIPKVDIFTTIFE